MKRPKTKSKKGHGKRTRNRLASRLSKRSQSAREHVLDAISAMRRGASLSRAARSGSKDSRPALNQLRIDAGQRSFDAVLVWKLDRFARSLKNLVNALADFESLGIAFISLRDNLDLTTPSGRLMFQIVGAMAEFERALIQERVKAGLAHARAKGVRLGRRDCAVNTSRVEILRGYGMSWGKVAAELGLSIPTIQKAMRARSANALVTVSSAEPEVLHV